MSKPSKLNGLFFDHLFKTVISGDSSPFNKMAKKLYDIDVDYFEKVPAWTERISSELAFQLKDDVLSDFGGLADNLLNRELKDRILGELNDCWNSATDKECDDRGKAAGNALAYIRESAPLYFDQFKPCPEINEDDLQKLYRKAKRRSLVERIRQNNEEDVIIFHHALMQKTAWECKELIETRIMRFIEEVLDEFAAKD